jgi:hypothetical protein
MGGATVVDGVIVVETIAGVAVVVVGGGACMNGLNGTPGGGGAIIGGIMGAPVAPPYMGGGI